MVDLSTLLDKEVEKTERPKPIPVGTYRMMVGGHKFGESSKKKTPLVAFELSFVEALEDVDTEALAAVEEQKPLGDRQIEEPFYMTESAMFRLKEFLEALGMSIAGGRTYSEVIPETRGCIIDAHFRHGFSDAGNAFAEIDSWKQVETD